MAFSLNVLPTKLVVHEYASLLKLSVEAGRTFNIERDGDNRDGVTGETTSQTAQPHISR
jgi:hypothetical protein